MALQCYQPQGSGSPLVFVRAFNHLTFEINSVTSEEDLVTDVTEESDHKTLKTNKQPLKTDTTSVIHSTPVQAFFAGTGAVSMMSPSVSCTF